MTKKKGNNNYCILSHLYSHNLSIQLKSETSKFLIHKLQIYKTDAGFYYFGQHFGATPQGRGIAIYQDGSVFEGFWHEGKRHISGRLIYSSTGNTYQGEWFKDTVDECFGYFVKLDGYGIKALWKHEKAEGEAFELASKDYWYRGNFKEGLKNGKGECHWDDNATYKGNFENNKFEGTGEYLYSNGRIYKGKSLI